MRLSQLGEINLLDRIIESLDPMSKLVDVGPGDDAAVINMARDSSLIVTSDLLVEDVHFWRDKISPENLGYKAGAVNISDIAAMAGRPFAAVVSLGLPGGLNLEYVDRFFEGLRSICRDYGLDIIGGDVASSEKICLCLSVLGKKEGRIMKRSGAESGQAIWVTGEIGTSAMGLKIIETEQKGRLKHEKAYLNKHIRPIPRVNEALFLAKKGATSMIDISDGLLTDLSHICKASGLSGNIYLDKLPVKKNFYEDCKSMGWDEKELLFSGEDYELLFTGLVEDLEKVRQKFRSQFNLDFNQIGYVESGNIEINIYDNSGKIDLIGKYGYEHFREQ